MTTISWKYDCDVNSCGTCRDNIEFILTINDDSGITVTGTTYVYNGPDPITSIAVHAQCKVNTNLISEDDIYIPPPCVPEITYPVPGSTITTCKVSGEYYTYIYTSWSIKCKCCPNTMYQTWWSWKSSTGNGVSGVYKITTDSDGNGTMSETLIKLFNITGSYAILYIFPGDIVNPQSPGNKGEVVASQYYTIIKTSNICPS